MVEFLLQGLIGTTRRDLSNFVNLFFYLKMVRSRAESDASFSRWRFSRGHASYRHASWRARELAARALCIQCTALIIESIELLKALPCLADLTCLILSQVYPILSYLYFKGG